MKTWKMRLMLLLVLVVGMTTSFTMGQRSSRPKLRPKTDAIQIFHTSGENGKWVNGCTNPPDSCNEGVGNVGPKYCCHWVPDK